MVGDIKQPVELLPTSKMRLNETHNLCSNRLRVNYRISCIHNNPRHIPNFIIRATLVPFHKPFQLRPCLGLMPSITASATTVGNCRPTLLQPPAPLFLITRVAFHGNHKRTGYACQGVKVIAPRQWGVDDNR